MIIDFFNRGGGGGGTAQYATSAGTADSSKLLDGIQSFPQSANTGDVVAINGEPLRGGMRSPIPQIEAGVYQYDGSNWNKIDASGSESYVIELSTLSSDDFTQGDTDNINDFFDAIMEDPAVAYTAYVLCQDDIFNCNHAYIDTENSGAEVSFTLCYPDWICNITINYYNGHFYFSRYDNTFNRLLVNDLPEDGGGCGELVNTVETVNPRPEAPDFQTVYGGDISSFANAVYENNNKIEVMIWDNSEHSAWTKLGWFYLVNYQLHYYDYQSDKDYSIDDFPIGEWTPYGGFGGAYVRKDGENVYFCVWREQHGVFFTNDVDMIFEDSEIEYQPLYKYDCEKDEWKPYPYALYSNDEQPIGLDTGDVYSAPYYVQTETITLDYATIISDIQNGDYSYFECYFDNHSNHFYVAGNGHFEWQGIKTGTTDDTNIVLIDDNEDPIQGLTDGMVIGSLINGEVFVQYDDVDGVITIIVNRADWDGSAEIPEGKDQAYVDEMCGGKDTETENGYAVYQIAENAESKTIVSVTFPNGYEDGNRYVSGYMEILIKKWPEQSAIVTTAEFLGSRYRFMVDDANNENVTVYDDNDDELIVIRDGESDTFVCEDGLGNDVDINCSLNGGIFYAKTSDDSSINWENTKNITEKFYSNYVKPLAFKDELPNKYQLIPTNWNAAELLMSNGVGVKPIWYPRDRVLVDSMFEAYPYDENDGVQFLARKSYWEVGWEKLDTSTLNPKDNLPVQAEEGTAFSNSSDGIVQAQGTTADTSNLYEIEMKNAWQVDIVGVKGLVVSGITTADRFVFRFDGNDDTHFVWNGSGWEVENFEIDINNGNGEISGHTTLSSTAVTIEISYDSNDGCYYFAFGRGWVQYFIGNDNNDFSTSTVWVRDLPVTQYKNAVMSSTIKEIVKCTQAEYDAMVSGGTVDNTTFYVIVNPQV